jgi:hypothetical protein
LFVIVKSRKNLENPKSQCLSIFDDPRRSFAFWLRQNKGCSQCAHWLPGLPPADRISSSNLRREMSYQNKKKIIHRMIFFLFWYDNTPLEIRK